MTEDPSSGVVVPENRLAPVNNHPVNSKDPVFPLKLLAFMFTTTFLILLILIPI